MIVEIGGINLASPVFLAPMAGITDVPFRNAVLRHGAGLVVSEMIASREMLSARPSTRARAELGLGDAQTAVQIAGNDPELMAETARICAGEGARIIDINFGCPAKKVTSGLSGSALMRDPDVALRIVEAVVAAVRVPVTVKMRLGWDEACLTAPEIARRAEAAGVRMICVHGRTRCQFYKGRADWDAIAAVRAAVRIPLIANGDIVSAGTAAEALARSGADGVMIGRGARGRPWLIAGIEAALAGRPVPAEPDAAARTALVIEHYEAMLSFYGIDLGVRVARKHLGWYLERLDGAEALRDRVIRLTDPSAVIRALQSEMSSCNSSRPRAAA